MHSHIKLIECPRDALQGFSKWVPTSSKVAYYQALLKVGFDTLDCVSFVSPKAIPQMKDSKLVIEQLDLSETQTKLLAIVANRRGAIDACGFDKIDYLGYPFSVSENFQIRNTKKTITESILVLQEIIEMAERCNKKVVVYLSMGFGNPYGDPWSPAIIEEWVARLSGFGVEIISLSDTIGIAQKDSIETLFKHLSQTHKSIEFGAHFHAAENTWFEKVNAAYLSGCKRFEGTIKGRGGCPMAQNEMIGNMPTERLISYFTAQQCELSLSTLAFESAYNCSHKIFM